MKRVLWWLSAIVLPLGVICVLLAQRQGEKPRAPDIVTRNSRIFIPESSPNSDAAPRPPKLVVATSANADPNVHKAVTAREVDAINKAVLRLTRDLVEPWEKDNAVLLPRDALDQELSYYLPELPQELQEHLNQEWQRLRDELIASLELDQWGAGFADRQFLAITELNRPNLVVRFSLKSTHPDSADWIWRKAVGAFSDLVLTETSYSIARNKEAPENTPPAGNLALREELDPTMMERYRHLVAVNDE